MTSVDPFDSPVTPELLGRLLDRHVAALVLFARQWTSAAEDCVQEAFVELAGQNPPPDDPVAWLYRVVRNRALNEMRSQQRRRRREAERAEDRPGWFYEDAAARLDSQTAIAALERLPDDQRQAIVARIWGGLTFEQIAELLNASTSTAHRCYLAGLAALRERLEDRCPTKRET